MSIRVERVDLDAEPWNSHVDRAPESSVFHHSGAIQRLAAHTGTTLHALVGYKGEEPIGILPLFEGSRGPLRTVVSPPDGFEVFSLGAVLLDPGQLKQRKLERRHRRFVDGCLDWVEETVSPHIVHIRSTAQRTDMRPYQQADFDVSPYYTYVVDLDRSEEELLGSFSSDARSNIRSAEEFDYTIDVGGEDACREIISRVQDRLDHLGKNYPLDQDAAAALYRELPEGTVKPYVCSVDGESLGGIVALEHGDTIYRWQGGTKVTDDFPVNDVLDWHVMQDARERGVDRYDLVGANLPRTAKYKAKFGPDAVAYYGAMRRAPGVGLLAKLRQHAPTGE